MIENLIKIGISLLLGLFVGWEREKNDKPAGLRTITNVCLGSTLFAIIGLKLLGNPAIDISRLFYAPIIGIGFLGGGVIMKRGKNIEGITTASILWIMVAVGLLCGLGDYLLATIVSLCIFLILKLKFVKIKIQMKKKRRMG